MIKLITDYTDGVKQKLTEQMAQQRSNINQHLKELSIKMKEIDQIISGVDIAEKRLQQIQDNEEAYIHKQMQQLQNQIDIEESLYLTRNRNDQGHNHWNEDSLSHESHDKATDLKKPAKQDEKQKNQDDKDQKLEGMNNYSPNSSNRSNEDYSNSSGVSSQNIGNHNIPNMQMDELHHILSQLDIDELSQAHKNLCMDTNSTEKFISLEDLDKLLLQNIRSEFYKYNT